MTERCYPERNALSECCTSIQQGHVDRGDQTCMQYSTCRWALRWWQYLFWFNFDVDLVNSKPQMHDQEFTRNKLSFRMNLCRQVIDHYRRLGKKKLVSTVNNCGNAHWPMQEEKNGQCKMCTKLRHEVLLKGKHCDIHLCVDYNCIERWLVNNLGTFTCWTGLKLKIFENFTEKLYKNQMTLTVSKFIPFFFLVLSWIYSKCSSLGPVWSYTESIWFSSDTDNMMQHPAYSHCVVWKELKVHFYRER